MSHTVKGILGAGAILLTFGAAQFASGHDLTGGLQALGHQQLQALGHQPPGSVNRAAKADRVTALRAPLAPTRTISFKLAELADTSILARIPLPVEARSNAAPASRLMGPVAQKPAVACEPVVSVLTEVAKRLQPGRCVT
jgi:hypothetical protein